MNNWADIRGKKVDGKKFAEYKNINFDIIYKRIQIICDMELHNIVYNKEEFVLPNKYGNWVIK